MAYESPLLEVKSLKQYFKIGKKYTVKAVNGVSFQIGRGETYGLVGESGSGKSTIGRAVIRLYEPTGGEISFHGQSITKKMDSSTSQMVRTKMQMIFQDPSACLNPRRKIGDIIAEGLDINHFYANKVEREDKILQIMERVGLAKEHAGRYPHQFSGGQKQRAGIARALIMNPDLIIADEAISALDVSIQAQIVNLMKDIQDEMQVSYLFISHDLSMVRYISDRIGVLHLGYLVETGTTDEIFSTPVHPYTKAMLSAIPHPDPRFERGRHVFGYHPTEFGIDYGKGVNCQLSDTHYVLATSEELKEWAGNSYVI